MALIRYYLLSLKQTVSATDIQGKLKAENVATLMIARPVEWMHLPTRADYLLAADWDLALALESDVQLPHSVTECIDVLYMVGVHMASSSTSYDIPESTHELPAVSFSDRPLRALCTQFHQITPSLLAFADHPLCPRGPVSMLNFVSYQPYPFAASSYQKYLNGVEAGPAKRFGIVVKLKGSVTPSDGNAAKGEWDLVFMAQYPSFKHFVDMGSDPEYQELNQKYRMPALRDLCILMTTEVDLEWTIPGSRKAKPEVSGFVASSTNQ